MKMSPREVERHADPFMLVIPLFVCVVYSLPTAYIIGMHISGDVKFDGGSAFLICWGGGATWAAVWMVRLYYQARTILRTQIREKK